MTSDLELLQDYVRNKSEESFAALVNRHVNLVYSAALRQVRSQQLAEEVAQSVFTDLARNSGNLKPDTILTAWLYAVTRRTAIDVIRKESRRQLREQTATEINAMNATEVNWTHIEPLLDEAMHALDETDRTAILLRYFENKSLREVGQVLGTSNDAAQKRVSRAVERLREFFAKRGITVGASGLVVVVSTNAVQAAPIGLAVTISTAAAIAGTSVATTATATITKAIAMTTLQKTIVTATVTVLAGAGIYEARQAAQLREQNQTLQQQQAPLTEQIKRLSREREEATRQLALLHEDNARLNRNTAELLELRGEVTRLRNKSQPSGQESRSDPPTDTAAKSWVNRANQLKEFAKKHPTEKIPEFEFLTEREWLVAADLGSDSESFRTDEEFSRGMQTLRNQAEAKLAHRVQEALRKYASANDGQFPSELSQLQSYCEPIVGDMLIRLYEIRPASVLSPWLVNDLKIKTEWVITRIKTVNSYSTSRLAIFADGTAYWQSPL